MDDPFEMLAQGPTWNDLTVEPPEPSRADWNDDGVLILPRFMPNSLMMGYELEWQGANGKDWPAESPGGWKHPTPYMENIALRRLFTWLPLQRKIEELIGEPPGLHLCLTGWVSTQRDWHQDTYLNPRHVGDSYAAVWIALDDIHPDSGPFQYVPGSHRWRTITQEKISRYLDIHDATWPAQSEALLSPLIERELSKLRHPCNDRKKDAGDPVVTYLPKRGDVLIWHGRLVHRGSRPRVPGMQRRAVIAHLSGITHRHDMPPPQQDPMTTGWYFPIHTVGQDNVMKPSAVTFD